MILLHFIEQLFDMPFILDIVAQQPPQAPAPSQPTIQTQSTAAIQDTDAQS
jgi:hypothetical protein